MREKLNVTVGRGVQPFPGIYVMTNNPSKFSVDFPVIFTDLWPQVTPGWSSGFLIKHVRKRVRRERDLRFLKVIATKVPTERFGGSMSMTLSIVFQPGFWEGPAILQSST